MSTYYPIHWIATGLFLEKDQGVLGVCAKTKMAVKVIKNTDKIAVWGIFAGEGHCTEAPRCMYMECGLNTTTSETLHRGTGLVEGELVLDLASLNAMPEVRQMFEDLCRDLGDEEDDAEGSTFVETETPTATFEGHASIHIRKAGKK